MTNAVHPEGHSGARARDGSRPRCGRRTRPTGALAFLVLASLCACSGSGRDTPRPPSQSVVLIGIDTVRFDTFWLPERRGIEDDFSPWARRALRFHQAQSTSPWTIPSVSSVFSGLYPQRHAAGRFASPVANLDAEIPTPLPEAVPVLADLLGEAGAATAAFSAHPWFGPKFKLGQGFGTLVLEHDRETLVAQARAWLRERREASPERPVFLYLHFMEAHQMHLRAPERVERYAQRLPADLRAAAVDAAPGDLCAEPGTLPCRRYLAYMRAITVLRATVADLLTGLADTGVLENAVVILYSDHGEEFEDHRREAEAAGTDPRGTFGSGHGQSLFQELLHVPLLVWAPGSAGADVERPVSLLDVFPTIVALAGIEVPDAPRRLGLNLLEPMGSGRSRGTERLLFSSGIAYGPQQAAVLRWPWKLVVRRDTGERVLYDLAADPLEREPVTELPEGAEGLGRRLSRYLALEPLTTAEAPTVDGEELKRLQSLGYLGGVSSREE